MKNERKDYGYEPREKDERYMNNYMEPSQKPYEHEQHETSRIGRAEGRKSFHKRNESYSNNF